MDESAREERSMKSIDGPTRQVFQLIVTRKSASEILFLQDGSGWSLPAVRILPRRRIAVQLTAEVKASWGLETYCLFLPVIKTSTLNTEKVNFALMESLGSNDRAPRGTCWLSNEEAVRVGGDGIGVSPAIREALQQLDSYVSNPERGPFGRPSWFGELLEWTQRQILPFGLRVTGIFRQFNASPTFSLIRLETSGPAVWFKATGEPNRHERSVSVCLARLFPAYVPVVWGTHSFWNGWISPEVRGQSLDNVTEVSAWESVARDLAQLQIASIGKHTELLESGSKDLRLPGLRREIEPFLARMAELMAAQQKHPPRALTNDDLALVRSSLIEACSMLETVGMPDTLGHMDFNPGNIFLSPESCVFIDWAEGAVTHPRITEEYLLEHYRQICPEDRTGLDRIRAAYVRPWYTIFSPADLEHQNALSSLVAVFACAVNIWRSRKNLDQASAGYLRSLTRRMFREARESFEWSGQCLA
jgi:hypothetical protein